jgi:hypothetical protein
MMDLLPSTQACQAHIRGHKASHEGMLLQLRKFSPEFLAENLDTAPKLNRPGFRGGWLV